MVRITATLSTLIKEGFRQIKVKVMGKNDIQTPDEASPYGLDSNPVKEVAAVFAQSTVSGEPVIIGYLQKNRLAEVGEMRLYSTDANGAQQNYIWLKVNGDILLGGDADNAVRFSVLESEFNELKGKFNDLVTAYNTHIHITTATVGATPTPGVISPTAATATASAADISGAKIDEVKTS